MNLMNSPNVYLTVLFFILSNILSLNSVSTLDSNLHPRVNAPCGPVVGTTTKTRGGRTVEAFLGIPFAKPPLGALRFEPPVPIDAWSEDLLATKQPKRCIQIIYLDASEDCLYLNVFTPNSSADPLLPVLVYLFGGLFEFGSAADYTPEYLLDHDFIYVVPNWRQGLFGYFSTGDKVVPGNMALKDVRLALRWVQKNIKAFGGDPRKVTIFGLSSGATAVHYFMTMAADEGLFRAAISHSGSALNSFALRPPADVQKTKEAIVSLTGCPGDSSGLVACLKEKSAVDLLILYNLKLKNMLYTPLQQVLVQFVPLVAPVLEPSCVSDAFVTKNPWRTNTSIPWLAGMTSKEAIFYLMPEILDPTGALFYGFNKVFDRVYPLFLNYQNSRANGSRIAEEARKFYLDNQPIRRSTLAQSVDMLSDGYFVYPIYESLLRNDPSKTYVFMLGYRSAFTIFPIPRRYRIGATHTDDLPIFFPHPVLPFKYPRTITVRDEAVSKQLIRLWVNFITHLDPSPSASDEFSSWELFSNNHAYLNIEQDGSEMKYDLLKDRMEFWQNQPYPNRDDDYGNIQCEVTHDISIK